MSKTREAIEAMIINLANGDEEAASKNFAEVTTIKSVEILGTGTAELIAPIVEPTTK